MGDTVGGGERSVPGIGLVILAAGASTRMGVVKQLLTFRGRRLLRHATEEALASGCRPVVVVLGAHAELLRHEIGELPVRVVVNARWSEGMGTSIRAGIEALTADAGGDEVAAAILAVCDQPFFSAGIIHELIAATPAFRRAIVAAAYEGTCGVPALFSRSLFPELMALDGREGARRVIQAHSEETFPIRFPEGAIDVDTPADYARLRSESRVKEASMSQVWLVTSSSRGLGRALAEAVLAGGHQLVATARNPAQLADLVERYGDQVRAVALDVTDARAAGHAIQAAVDAFGRLDVLVNNAGYGDVCSIEDTSLADFRAQIETNLFGVVNVTKAAIPLMREQGSGHIIQISSIGGRVGPPGGGAYSTAKWGVEGFSEVLVKEVGPLGIKVTLIEPGGMRTDFAGASTTIRDSRPEYDSTVGAMARYQRDSDGAQPGDPVKAAAVILHIASLDEPPLRLLLGSDAVHSAEQNDLARMEADRKWRELSVSTDFEAGGGSNAYPWEREANGTAHS